MRLPSSSPAAWLGAIALAISPLRLLPSYESGSCAPSDAPPAAGCRVQFDPSTRTDSTSNEIWSRAIDAGWTRLALDLGRRGERLCSSRWRPTGCTTREASVLLTGGPFDLRRLDVADLLAELDARACAAERRSALLDVGRSALSPLDLASDVRHHLLVRVPGGAPVSATRILFGDDRCRVQAFGFAEGQQDRATAQLRAATRLYLPAGSTSGRPPGREARENDAIVEFELEGSTTSMIVASCDLTMSLCGNWREARDRMARATPVRASRADTVLVPTFGLAEVACRRWLVDSTAVGGGTTAAFVVADLRLATADEGRVSQPRSLAQRMMKRRAQVAFVSPFIVAVVDRSTGDPWMLARICTTEGLTVAQSRPLEADETRPFVGRWVMDRRATVARTVREFLAYAAVSTESDEVGEADTASRAAWLERRASRIAGEVDVVIEIDAAADAKILVRRRVANGHAECTDTIDEFQLEWDTDSFRLSPKPRSPRAVGSTIDRTFGGLVTLESGSLVISPSVGLVDNPVFRRESR